MNYTENKMRQNNDYLEYENIVSIFSYTNFNQNQAVFTVWNYKTGF